MSEKTSGNGSVALRLLLAILLTFSLLGTVGCAMGCAVLKTPIVLTRQIKQQNAAEKVYYSLNTKFSTEYNTTAVPAEVYMDVISVDWLEQRIIAQVKTLYGDGEEAATDYTALEESITAYFEQFAEENDVEKDDTYTEKLSETITNAEDAITEETDICQIQTITDAGYLPKLQKLGSICTVGAIGCAVVAVVWMLLLRKRYWIGTGCFAAGLLLAISSIAVFCSGIIGQFVYKDAATYSVVTGTMTNLTYVALVCGFVLLALGGVLTELVVRKEKRRRTGVK